MAKWNEYGLKTGTSARDEVLILDSDTNTNKRITVGDIQEFANGKMLEKENATLNTETKTLIGAINEVDAKNDTQDKSLEAIEKKFSGYVKKTDVDSTLSVSGSPADAKVVGDALKKDKEAIAELADKKITKFYASSQGDTHLPDSDKGKIQDMFLYGKSEQAQYKGKNLLNYTRGSTTINGVTFTVNADKTITVNGTATADAIFILLSNITVFFEKGDSFKLVGCPSGGSNSKYDARVFVNNVGIFYDYGSGVVVSKTEETNSNIAVVIRKGYTANNLLFKPMLTTDTTATYADFEPYVGGIPSPSPDYPQEIKAVVNPKVVVMGKNLLKAIGQTQTINGVTFTNNSDGTYTVNGTSTANALTFFSAVSTFTIKENGKYKLTGLPKGQAINDDIWFGGTRVESAKEDVVLALKKGDILNLVFVVRGGATLNNVLLKPMLSLDTTATYDDYEPYTEQSVTLPYTLYAIPVSTGGNVTIGGQQYVADYVDVERGKLVRSVRAITFTGSEGWVHSSEDDERQRRFGLRLSAKCKMYVGLSNYVINSGVSIINKENSFVIYADWIDVRITRFTTSAEFKNFLSELNSSGKPLIVICALATPEEIDLTPEQIQAYKSLSTNYPVTNIEVSSEQLDGYTIFNYPISMAEGWNYVKQQIGDTRDYIYDMDLQSAEAYVNSEYAVALAELEVM